MGLMKPAAARYAGIDNFRARVIFRLAALLAAILGRLVQGITNPNDVAAINSLHAAFGNPNLPGWVATGGDPCGGAWQGVQCDPANNIISITLVGANLGGGLGDNLGSFSAIKLIDLSNNRIGGSIPTKLPLSVQNFYLSGNNFTGSIPSAVSSLTQLSALKLNNNYLTGEIPDAFEPLLGLASLDLSSNSLHGGLPSSMGSLPSLAGLHLQSNQLSGSLDVLKDLPLQDLDIRNNLFGGPIPEQLLRIPSFKKDGNPFNISSPSSPSPPPASPTQTYTPGRSAEPPPLTQTYSPGRSAEPPPLTQTYSPGRSAEPPPPSPLLVGSAPYNATSSSSGLKPDKQVDANAPSSSTSRADQSSSKKANKARIRRIALVSIVSVMAFVILLLALLLCLPSCFSRSKRMYYTYRRDDVQPYKAARENPPDNTSLLRPSNQLEKARKDAVVGPEEMARRESAGRILTIPKPRNEEWSYVQRPAELRRTDSDTSDIDTTLPPPPPPPPSLPPQPIPLGENVIVRPAGLAEAETIAQTPLTSVKLFTIASLQQYTNSFSRDNLIGNGMLGSVYRAELPNGKLLAVKKLDKKICCKLNGHQFIELVNDIDRIRHANIVELIGYCAEYGQMLLIYEYCPNGTLQDALQSDDEYKKQLSWSTRIQMAVGVARALAYLHEACEPPIVHRNLKATNILLDEDLSVRVSDCGLASLMVSGSAVQLSGQLLSTYGYGAPEFEYGVYTLKSDVYSFGVVMLELLTGRKSYDGTMERGEQFLVRWAVPQLHDIDALSRMVDPSLHGQYPAKSLSHFADVIFRCVQSEPEFRPSMSEVVHDLQRLLRRGSPTEILPQE